MAFENIGKECDREMEKLAQELLKMEKEFAQQLFRGISNLYHSWQQHRDDTRLQEQLNLNKELKDQLDFMKINYKDLFREFEQTGFDPSRPQHDPTQAQNQSQTVNEDVEFNADGATNINDLDDLNINDLDFTNIDDINLNDIGETFSMNNMFDDVEFEQMSIFDLDGIDAPSLDGGDMEIPDIEIPDFELA